MGKVEKEKDASLVDAEEIEKLKGEVIALQAICLYLFEQLSDSKESLHRHAESIATLTDKFSLDRPLSMAAEASEALLSEISQALVYAAAQKH